MGMEARTVDFCSCEHAQIINFSLPLFHHLYILETIITYGIRLTGRKL